MPSEPSRKGAVAFVDGQNLYHAAREAFGHTYPRYDVLALATEVCRAQQWFLSEARFYTGVADASDNSFWNHFWTGKMSVMGRQGIVIYSRSLRYRNQVIRISDGTEHTILTGVEKGIDVRIAIDVIRLALRRAYDVALIFSQDQDLSEVADEIREIAREQTRWIKIACAYPFSPTSINRRGVDRTDWIHIDRATYERCLDRRDYRPKSRQGDGA